MIFLYVRVKPRPIACIRIWEGYKEFKQLRNITRSGFGLCGIYPLEENEEKLENGQSLPESDLEHIAGMMNLVFLISMHYPSIIPKEELSDYLIGAMIHEIGELETGDIPDDGIRDEKKKLAIEQGIVCGYLRNSIPSTQVCNFYDIFEDMNEYRTVRGRTLHFLDKLEAVLQALIYEAEGNPGHTTHRKEKYGIYSRKDAQQMENTETDVITDNWAWSLFDSMRQKNYEFAEVIREIVNQAVKDVRGKYFDWEC